MSLWDKLKLKYDYDSLPHKRWLIYSCNMGDYDKLEDFADSLNKKVIEDNLCPIDEIDFKIFIDVNSKFKAEKYNRFEIIKVPLEKSHFEDEDRFLTSRKYKLSIDHIFGNYKRSLYIDCNCRLGNKKIYEVMSRFEKSVFTNDKNMIKNPIEIMGIHHNKHKNYDSEANHAGQRLTKDRVNKLKEQRGFYNSLEYDKKMRTMPFITGRFLLRKHTNAVKELCNFWYEQAEEWTHRDQVSWQYVWYNKGFKKISLDVIQNNKVLNSHDLQPTKHLK